MRLLRSSRRMQSVNIQSKSRSLSQEIRNSCLLTNFFAASTSNGSDGYDDDEGYDEEVYDSILEETANILPNRTLLWHYRSKHEHLIAFSNQEIYKNELNFPKQQRE